MAENEQAIVDLTNQIGNVADLVREMIGVSASFRVSYTTVGSTPSEVVKANPNRAALILINNSASTVYVSFIPEVTTSKGFILTPSGGSISMQYKEDFILPTLSIHGYCSNDSQALTVVEALIGGGF